LIYVLRSHTFLGFPWSGRRLHSGGRAYCCRPRRSARALGRGPAPARPIEDLRPHVAEPRVPWCRGGGNRLRVGEAARELPVTDGVRQVQRGGQVEAVGGRPTREEGDLRELWLIVP
jgi:hypothetical protein